MTLCSRVTVLSQGTALVSGTPAEIRNNPAVLDAYLGGEDDASTQQQLAAQAARPRRAGHGDAGRTTAPEPVDGPAPLLRIQGVTAGYGGGDILKEVSLDVPRGSITCVVGPNGAGKSTLLATISGLLRPRAGRSSSTARRSPGTRRSRSSGAGWRRSRRPTASSTT